jgi:N-carbamoylputrescine amidase
VSRPLTVTAVQLGWQQPGTGQRERTTRLAAAALRDGADLVLLPELAMPGYTTGPGLLEQLAEPLDGPSVTAWREAAAAGGGYIAGGFCERAGAQLFNSAVIVGADGVLLHYRKAHLFGAEKRVLAPGDSGFGVVPTKAGVLGLCVCYDLRFVEVVRLLALQGAELVCVPTAWIGGYDVAGSARAGPPGQVTGLLVQANLNQVFIAAASFTGRDGSRDFLGCSVIADPYGAAVAGPMPPEQAGTLTAVIDLDAADAAQRRSELIRPRDDRRRDLYVIEQHGHRY